VGRANFLLSYEFFWLSRFREGVEHGREAIRLLEESNEQWWAANASWMMGMNCTHLGEFEAALAAQAHTDAIGRLIGDDHLVNCAAWAKGLTLATLGDWASGVSLCQEAIEHSRDHFNTTRATVILGFSRLQQGEAGEAILILKRAADTVAQSGFTRLRVWIMGWLAEAYLLNDDPAQARETALAVVQVGTALDWPFGIAVAQRVLGRVHLRYNEFANAEREFTAALGTFSTIGAAFEAARTQIDLAELDRLRSDAGAALDHLREARHMFEVLGLPSFVARTDSLLSALPPKKGRRPS
jgi:tetratricopeptide (TPR) repeat protein